MPAVRKTERLGEILARDGKVSTLQLRSLLKEQADFAVSRTERPRLGELLLRYQLVDETELARALAAQHHCPYLEPEPENVRPQLFADIPAALVRSYRFVPLGRDEETLTIGVSDFDEPDLAELLRSVTGLTVTHGFIERGRFEGLREVYLASLCARQLDVEVLEPTGDAGTASERGAPGPGARPEVPATACGPATPSGRGSGSPQASCHLQPAAPPAAAVHGPSELPVVSACAGEPVVVPFPQAVDPLVHRLLQTSLRERYCNVAFSPGEGPVWVVARRPGGRSDRTQIPPERRARLRRVLATIVGLDEATLMHPVRRRFLWPHDGGAAVFETVFFPPSSPQLDLNLIAPDRPVWTLDEAGLPLAALQLMTSVLSDPCGLVVLSGPTPLDSLAAWVAILSDLAAKDRKVLAFENGRAAEIPGVFHHDLGGRDPTQQILFSTSQREAIVPAHSEAIALRTERLPAHLPYLLEMSRHDATLILTMAAFSPLSALRSLEQTAGATVHNGLFVTAYRLPRLCPFCREGFPIAAGGLPRGFQALAGKIAYRARGCDVCQNAGRFGPVHFYEVLRLDGERLDRDGVDLYSRPLKEYLLEEGLLVPVLPAARKAMLAGTIGLDDYLALASR
ncbi:MAG: hypothetical protein HY814_13505 [Candidatus Riflebacteria bacterium]|nr:hypothetical protein [Candidatus Riflebacteria bacterium]